MENTTPTDDITKLNELKEQATALGVTFHPAIGLETLAGRVDEALLAQINAPAAQEDPGEPKEPEPVAPPVVIPETPAQKRLRQKKAATRLVRVIVTCLNPNKRDWDGEIFTAGSSSIATIKNFVPFNNPEGWHVPQIILNIIERRQFQAFIKIKDAKGNTTSKGILSKEFNVTILPSLTNTELTELAASQASRRAID